MRIREELIELARRTAGESGRDPDALDITVSFPGDVDDLARLKAHGVDRVLVPISPMPGMGLCLRTPEEVLAYKPRLEELSDG